jgi:serine/threonine protein kinase/Tol biopolymer transport system component
LIGSTVSHYQILERLGGGGMGVVYKARDLKLDRLVALKFLASQRGASEEHKRRFLREARTASQLDHPNICTIYEIGEAEDGALFIAMALYEGETLRDRIERGTLPIAEAIDVAGQIAAGLAAAHARGIVHRDVKPANVILTPGGQVKLLDFGIAKLADQSRLTRAGAALGTVAYMSPEQFRGGPGDARADVWSLGVVLYEMVTGRLPFGELSAQETVQAILERSPRPMSALRSGVPERLERIVTRALAKRPEDRYASMEPMRADLREIAGADAGPDADRTLLEIPLPAAAPAAAEPLEGGGLVGRQVGPYRILELLGGGGMGVVYKAEDTRLARTVALKFLPPELTRDPEAKERFMQEARTASSLDHPNLCTILEVGETPDGRLYLAMPCYDGETLRRKLERGPLTLPEALDVAEQAARGLAKAHRNGIVHRDVKPANLIVTGDGVVKILDFGLAKLAGSAAVSRTGSSAGTPAYMSPEQARGDDVDFRTDHWSLGVILYEMLAGRRPFRADNEQAVIYALLNERPRRLRELRPEVPPEVERIVGRLLAKEPADRYPTIEGPLTDLQALRGEPATGTTWLAAAPPRRVRPWLWAALAAALAAGLAGSLLYDRGAPAVREPVQATFTRLTNQEGREWYPSLSPDGEFFVYARESSPGNLDVYLQRVGGSNPINLTAESQANDTQPAYSPDGKLIAFRSDRDGGGIFLMEATGESVRRLTDFGYNPAWSPDSREVLVATWPVSDPRVFSGPSQIWRVEVASGRRRLVMKENAVQPSWSPHRLRVAYWNIPREGGKREIWTVPAEGGDAVRVTDAADDSHFNWNPVWAPDGRFLYFVSDRGGSMNLARVPIDEATGRVQGDPEPLTTPSPWSGLLSLSGDGRRILYAARDAISNLERAPFDPERLAVTGPSVPITQGSREIGYGRVSPDGQWIVFYTTAEDLFLVRTDGTGLRQITRDSYRDRNPGWSPDGRQILFYSDRSGRYEAWTLRPDGSDLRQVTRTRGEPVFFPLWSPDGRRLVCGLGFTGPAFIALTEPIEKRIPQRLPPVPGNLPFFANSWSPDGRRLAGYVRGNRGLLAFSVGTAQYEKLADLGNQPVWMHDNRRLVYLNGGAVHLFDTLTRKSRLLLAPPAGSRFDGVDVGPDDRALYLIRATEEGDIWMLSLR